MKTGFDFIRKVMVLAVAGLALFSSAPLPASAASPSYVVNMVALSCLGPGSAYTSIQTAINDAKANGVKTIKICPGTYAGLLTIDGINGLKLTAAMPETNDDWPVITPPAASIGGSAIHVTGGSKGITLEKLIIDGTNFAAANANMYGIRVNESSALVQDVTVWKIRNNPLDASPSGYAFYITDWDLNNTSASVSLKRVHVSDFQTMGIFVSGKVKFSLLESRIDADNGAGTPRVAEIHLTGDDLGIPTGTIARNVIEGTSATAIVLHNVSKMSITGNTIQGNVTLEADCAEPGAVANNNKISGNTFPDVVTSAVNINAYISLGTQCNPQVNNNTISNNIVMARTRPGTYPFYLSADAPAGNITPQAKGNKFTGNRIYGFCCVALSVDAADPAILSKNVVVP